MGTWRDEYLLEVQVYNKQKKRKEKLYLLERWIAFSLYIMLFVDVFLFSLMFIKVMIYLSEWQNVSNLL